MELTLCNNGGVDVLDFSATTIQGAKAKALGLMPSDTRVVSFSVRDICAIMVVRSRHVSLALSADGMKSDGRVAIEFNNSTENTAHTVYDPNDVDTAVFDALESSDPIPAC